MLLWPRKLIMIIGLKEAAMHAAYRVPIECVAANTPVGRNDSTLRSRLLMMDVNVHGHRTAAQETHRLTSCPSCEKIPGGSDVSMFPLRSLNKR